MSEKKYLQNTLQIEGPAVATDALLFTVEEGLLKVLLLQIKDGIYKEKWALPGGFVRFYETLEDTIYRVLKDKTDVKKIYLEQLYTFSDLKRDLRSRVISVAYMALINSSNYTVQKNPKYLDIRWISVDKLPKLAFDHKKIINYGIQRLRNKLSYTNIVYNLLGDEFTLTEMQRVYEIILDKKLDKRNFRKKIDKLNILKFTGKYKKTGAKPAKLYKFKDTSIHIF